MGSDCLSLTARKCQLSPGTRNKGLQQSSAPQRLVFTSCFRVARCQSLQDSVDPHPTPSLSHILRSPRQASQRTLAPEDCPAPTEASCPTKHLRYHLVSVGLSGCSGSSPLCFGGRESHRIRREGGGPRAISAPPKEAHSQRLSNLRLESGLPQPRAGGPQTEQQI